MTRDEYERLPGINWSRLRSMRISPRQFQYDVRHPPTQTPSMRIGSALHLVLLEAARAADAIVVWSGQRRGKAWETFRDKHAGREILTASEYARVRGMADAVLAHPLAVQRLAGTDRREQLLQWTDDDTGLPCKGIADLVGDRVREIKTGRDIRPRVFSAEFARLAYHGQLAYYHDGAEALGFGPLDVPEVIAVQSEPPHDVAVYEIPHGVLDDGRALYRRLLRRLAECLETDAWPGAVESVQPLWLPQWAAEDDLPDLPLTIGGQAMEV